MNWKWLWLLAGLGCVGLATVEGHTLAVDMDLGTPGIQSSASAASGSVLTVGIVLVDDGVSGSTGVGLSLNFNDAGPVVAQASPVFGGPPAAGVDDLVTNSPVGNGVPLAVVPVGPFGVGSGGPYAATTEGVGYFNPFGGSLGFGAFFGFPGNEVLLMTVNLQVIGSVGSTTDLAPAGILPFAPGFAADPKAFGPLVVGGAHFWDADPFTMAGGYPATAITPGSLTVVPEPGSLALLVLGAGLLGRRRRR